MMPGLDVEDSGYENIFTAGMLLGMSRDQLENKIPEIEEFCELGEYLSLPVRTYSTGMTMRLGFAIITAIEPGILLMDEGFGTGDLRFTERAAERADSFIGKSRIIVLASHSDTMIQSMCNKAAIMQEGRIVSIGPVDEVLEEYHALVHKAAPLAGTPLTVEVAGTPLTAEVAGADEDKPELKVYSDESIRDVSVADRQSRSSGAVRITRMIARDASNQARWTYAPGETVVFRCEYEVLQRVPDLVFYFRLSVDTPGNPEPVIITDVYEILSRKPLGPGYVGAIELTFPDLKLMPHQLQPYVWMGRVDYGRSYDVIDRNVGLPDLVVESRAKSKQVLFGAASQNYQVRKLDLRVPSTVANGRI
jgi:ABC-type multidrug transport system ATPase subunit